ncbi:unnamed protein product [Diamesa hyperborea]
MRKVTSVLLILWILQFIDNGVSEVNIGNSSESTGYLNLSSINYAEMKEQLKYQAMGLLGKCSAQETRDEIDAKMKAFEVAMKNYTGIDASTPPPSNPEDMMKLIHKLCESKFMEVEIKFIEEIGGVLRNCLDKDVLPMFEKIYKLLIRSQHIFCSTKDEDILNLMKLIHNKSSVDTSCIQSLSSHFSSCITSSNEIIELAENRSSWKSFGMNIIDGGAKECGIYDKFQKCIVKIMEPCPDQLIPNAIKFLFNFLYRSMNCDAT